MPDTARDHLIAVKGNQPNLLRGIEFEFEFTTEPAELSFAS